MGGGYSVYLFSRLQLCLDEGPAGAEIMKVLRILYRVFMLLPVGLPACPGLACGCCVLSPALLSGLQHSLYLLTFYFSASCKEERL